MQLDLKTAMARRRCSVSELARAVGVHKSTISRLYRGESAPMHETANAIADALRYKRGTIRYPRQAPSEAVA